MSVGTKPKWVLLVGILLLLWNLVGVAMFAKDMMMSPADIAALPKEQQMLWAQMPTWGWVAFGVSTVSGVLAALGIVMSKRWAATLALVSVLGVIGNFIPAFVLSKGVDVWQPQYLGLPITIFVIALFQLWLARKANANGWTS